MALSVTTYGASTESWSLFNGAVDDIGDPAAPSDGSTLSTTDSGIYFDHKGAWWGDPGTYTVNFLDVDSGLDYDMTLTITASGSGVYEGSTISGAILFTLGEATFTGDINDRIFQWLYSLGFTTGTLNDKWLAHLEAEGFTSGTLDDRKKAYYISLGASSSSTLSDAELWVWINTPPP